MTNYRRDKHPGATWFFTVNIAQRYQCLLIDNIDILRSAFRSIHASHPFIVNAIVILPDHLHTIWTLPEDDANYPLRWRLIKTYFSKSIKTSELVSLSRKKKGERGIWQRRYWEHRIRSEKDFNRHIDYIHYNPVKHGYVNQVSQWPWSSFHRFVRDGLLDSDWGAGVDCHGQFGERV